MEYISTRGFEARYSSAEAILQGLAPDGGLLVPASIPKLTERALTSLIEQSFPERVAYILSLFLTDFSYRELLDAALLAYDEEKFSGEAAKLVQINPYNDFEYMLELWHGPTSAFKDMALQLLPHLMSMAVEKVAPGKEVLILTATSGDTGKAALEGFRDVPGTKLICFYPKGGVSRIQELQMTTSTADNLHVMAVEGNFDEAQAGIKSCMANAELREELAARGILLTSANSINWGRLVTQIAYYWSAYLDLVKREKIEWDTKLNFAVPTGNFGNILAAWYAREMGLPVNMLICASNRNNVLSDFLRTGSYSIKRQLFKTNTPSMDILISSNLERLLFEMSGQDAGFIRNMMKDLTLNGEYFIGHNLRKSIQSVFVGGFADDKGVIRTILQTYDDTDHVVDPHTAVAFNVYSRYRRRARDYSPVVYVATASPFKFAGTVCSALFNEDMEDRNEMDLWPLLSNESDLEIPSGLQKLTALPVIHEESCTPEEIETVVLDLIKAKGVI